MKNTTKKALTGANVFLIDREGELVDLGFANVSSQRSDVNKNFFMLFNGNIVANAKTGIFQLDFIFYLLGKMSNKNTIPFITDEKIAKDLGVCRQTVETYKKKLHAAGLIKYSAGGIFINPEFIFKGNAYKRTDCVIEYRRFIGIGDKPDIDP